ncbi:MAG TPA: OB-fold domain-containing protein, partial [Acidimicrobiales bacterium]
FDPYFMTKVPYTLAVIELPEQPNLKLVSNVVDIDPDEVRIGMPVEVAFTEVSPEVTLPLFRPAS